MRGQFWIFGEEERRTEDRWMGILGGEDEDGWEENIGKEDRWERNRRVVNRKEDREQKRGKKEEEGNE